MRLFAKLSRSLKSGAKLLPPDAFVQVISDALWTSTASGDHIPLKRKIRAELRKLQSDPQLTGLSN
jgi:hypothetical protein